MRGLVLVAEDDADSRELLSEMFQQAGYDVTVAADGREAVSLAEARHPHVVVMDLAMPGMDGLEAARRIKAESTLHDVPIIAYTATPWMVDRRLFSAVCSKPCAPERLLGLVATATNSRH